MEYILQKTPFQDSIMLLRKLSCFLSRALIMCAMLLASTYIFADDVEINETNFPDPAFRKCIDSLATLRGG